MQIFHSMDKQAFRFWFVDIKVENKNEITFH